MEFPVLVLALFSLVAYITLDNRNSTHRRDRH